jgi:hypothetical protein
MTKKKTQLSEQACEAVEARFEYNVPVWLSRLLSDSLAAMLLIDPPDPDPDADVFADRFREELVRRLVWDVPYEDTAEMLGIAMADELPPSQSTEDQARYAAFQKAIRDFYLPPLMARRALMAKP